MVLSTVLGPGYGVAGDFWRRGCNACVTWWVWSPICGNLPLSFSEDQSDLDYGSKHFELHFKISNPTRRPGNFYLHSTYQFTENSLIYTIFVVVEDGFKVKSGFVILSLLAYSFPIS